MQHVSPQSWYSTLCSGALAAILFCLSASAQAQATPDVGKGPYEWDKTFPIWGKKLAKKGIAFPLPWGVGMNYTYVNQDVEIPEVAIAVNDSDYVDLTDVIDFSKVKSKVHAANLRLDLWLLPFLNVYALGNYVIDAKTAVNVSEPFTFQANSQQNGVGGGFGTTAAFGAWGFFGIVDMNWTWNKMKNLTKPVSTFMVAPRIGRKFEHLGPFTLATWVGAMRQQVGANTTGTVNLRDVLSTPSDEFEQKLADWYDGLGPAQKLAMSQIVDGLQNSDGAEIHYRLKKQLKHKWNMTLGAELQFNDYLMFRTEVGFIGRTQVICGFAYRFGGMGQGLRPEAQPKVQKLKRAESAEALPQDLPTPASVVENVEPDAAAAPMSAEPELAEQQELNAESARAEALKPELTAPDGASPNPTTPKAP